MYNELDMQQLIDMCDGPHGKERVIEYLRNRTEDKLPIVVTGDYKKDGFLHLCSPNPCLECKNYTWKAKIFEELGLPYVLYAKGEIPPDLKHYNVLNLWGCNQPSFGTQVYDNVRTLDIFSQRMIPIFYNFPNLTALSIRNAQKIDTNVFVPLQYLQTLHLRASWSNNVEYDLSELKISELFIGATTYTTRFKLPTSLVKFTAISGTYVNLASCVRLEYLNINRIKNNNHALFTLPALRVLKFYMCVDRLECDLPIKDHDPKCHGMNNTCKCPILINMPYLEILDVGSGHARLRFRVVSDVIKSIIARRLLSLDIHSFSLACCTVADCKNVDIYAPVLHTLYCNHLYPCFQLKVNAYSLRSLEIKGRTLPTRINIITPNIEHIKSEFSNLILRILAPYVSTVKFVVIIPRYDISDVNLSMFTNLQKVTVYGRLTQLILPHRNVEIENPNNVYVREIVYMV